MLLSRHYVYGPFIYISAKTVEDQYYFLVVSQDEMLLFPFSSS